MYWNKFLFRISILAFEPLVFHWKVKKEKKIMWRFLSTSTESRHTDLYISDVIYYYLVANYCCQIEKYTHISVSSPEVKVIHSI